jgi:formylglycine-generating enzyme required for sulfatase activity
VNNHLLAALAVLILVNSPVGAQSQSACGWLLSGISKPALGSQPKIRTDGTQGLIAYLGVLLEQQVIGDSHLIRLIDGLEKGGFENPISEDETLVSSPAQVHRDEIQEYLSSTNVNRQLLLEWASSAVSEKSRVRVRREEAKIETYDTHQKMEFHRVEPGEFLMGEPSFQVPTKITKSFEMMSTPVTQWQWAMLMSQNPSFHMGGNESEVLNIRGTPIRMNSDYPIEGVTPGDIKRFFERLNKMSDQEDPELVKVIPDHKRGDKYRLPTEAEWEFVVRDRGAVTGNNHYGEDTSVKDQYGWNGVNSNDRTHPVAQLKPFFVDGKAFYNLSGNVWELMGDRFVARLKGGTDPLGPPPDGQGWVIRGGSYMCQSAASKYTCMRAQIHSTDRNMNVGFRAVRVRP